MTSLREEILRQCEQRGWISDTVAHRVRSLCSHGPHVEQALLGTGVLSVDDYGELLSELSGLPFIRLEGEPTHVPHARWRDWQAWPLSEEERTWRVAVAEPTQERLATIVAKMRTQGRTLEPFVTLTSDVRRMWNAVLPRQQERSFHGRRFLQTAQPMVHHGDHPTHWLGTSVEPEQVKGLLVIVTPDAHVRSRFETGSLDDVWRGAGDEALVVHASTPRELESAAQAAMVGKNVVMIADRDIPLDEWLHDTETPVHVLRATHLPDGVAWESHRL